jgi:hypothetical protein
VSAITVTPVRDVKPGDSVKQGQRSTFRTVKAVTFGHAPVGDAVTRVFVFWEGDTVPTVYAPFARVKVAKALGG